MRLRIVRTPTESRIDGIRLDRFRVGAQYEIGTALGALFLAEGWAVPVPDDAPPPASRAVEYQPPDTPPNLIIDSYRPYSQERFSGLPEGEQAPDRDPQRRHRRDSQGHKPPGARR
jgi:hypothetical protein